MILTAPDRQARLAPALVGGRSVEIGNRHNEPARGDATRAPRGSLDTFEHSANSRATQPRRQHSSPPRRRTTAPLHTAPRRRRGRAATHMSSHERFAPPPHHSTHDVLKAIFRHYCGRTPAGAERKLDNKGWAKLCADAPDLVQDHFTVSDADIVFVHSVRGPRGDALLGGDADEAAAAATWTKCWPQRRRSARRSGGRGGEASRDEAAAAAATRRETRGRRRPPVFAGRPRRAETRLQPLPRGARPDVPAEVPRMRPPDGLRAPAGGARVWAGRRGGRREGRDRASAPRPRPTRGAAAGRRSLKTIVCN